MVKYKNVTPLEAGNWSEVLRDLIYERDTTQKAVSIRSGVSETALTYWLQGKSFPRLDMLCAALGALGKQLVIVDK